MTLPWKSISLVVASCLLLLNILIQVCLLSRYIQSRKGMRYRRVIDWFRAFACNLVVWIVQVKVIVDIINVLLKLWWYCQEKNFFSPAAAIAAAYCNIRCTSLEGCISLLFFYSICVFAARFDVRWTSCVWIACWVCICYKEFNLFYKYIYSLSLAQVPD